MLRRRMAASAALWRLLPDVRVQERSRFLFFGGLVALLAFAQTLGLAASEALFVAKLGAPAILCLWYALQAILINHFWTFASDYFDTLASKRLFPLFTAGTSVGGAAGGLVAMGLPTPLP